MQHQQTLSALPNSLFEKRASCMCQAPVAAAAGPAWARLAAAAALLLHAAKLRLGAPALKSKAPVALNGSAESVSDQASNLPSSQPCESAGSLEPYHAWFSSRCTFALRSARNMPMPTAVKTQPSWTDEP